MPAPVTHIVLALIVLPMMPDKNIDEFLLGTSFPDVRYVAHISRERTHNPNSTWHSIQKESSSFTAGMDFHALCDRIHEQFMTANKAYDLILASNIHLKGYILKLFEDMIFYDYVTNWPTISDCFDVVLDESLAFGVEKRVIKKWQQGLKYYLSEKPTLTSTIELIAVDYPITHYLMPGCLDMIMPALSNTSLEKIIHEFYTQFLLLLAQSDTL